MVKPELPEDIQLLFPIELVRLINSFVPHYPKKVSPKTSPSLQKELTRIQSKCFRGKSSMYMMEFDDFILDRYDC